MALRYFVEGRLRPGEGASRSAEAPGSTVPVQRLRVTVIDRVVALPAASVTLMVISSLTLRARLNASRAFFVSFTVTVESPAAIAG